MTKTILIPISLITVTTLAGSIGCSKDPKDSGLTQGEDEIVEKARVGGTVAGDDGALEGAGELSAATEAQVVSVDEDGFREVHGSGSIEADGSFEIEAEGMTRTFLVELFDAQGRLMGATIGTASSTSDTVVEVGEVSSETTVEAMVWAEVVVDSGFETVSSAEVRARTDRTAAMAAQLWYDAHAGGEALFSSIADALVLAHHSRLDAAAEAGIELDTELQSRVLGQIESAETSSELAMGLDAAFEAEGMAAVDRSAMAAQVEASLRAAIEATLDRSQSEGGALIDAYQDSSAQVEARAQAEAWGVLAAGEEGGTALAVELHSQLEAAAEACETGSAGIVEVQAWSEALIVRTVDVLIENDLDAGLLVELGLEAGVDEATVAEALVTLVSTLRNELAAELQAAAEAQVSGEGQLDASAAADAQAAVWADTAAQISPYRVVATLDAPGGALARVEVVGSDLAVEINTENRAVFLFLLARRWAEDAAAGVPETRRGWMDDDDVAIGVWGRDGPVRQLKVLVCRVRQELREAGLDPWFVEKRRGALRLRVAEALIEP